ncbi:MAG: UDP-glucose 4-epimerase family protein [Candidatus Electronema sp. VV]
MILVTGTTGFVGSALLPALSLHHHIRPVIRAEFGDFLPTTDYTTALSRAEVVIHLAARVHIMHDTVADSLEAFRRTNTAGTLNLARQAAAAGVRRFIFLSSIKVNGESTQYDQSFTAADICQPDDHYAISKYEAEQGLKDISTQTGMEIVIIRPPLVYGAGVKGNFLSMMRWLHKGIPLPFGAVHNQRSLVALDNLIDLITVCIEHPAAANQTFLVSDGEDLSTTELLQRLGAAMGRPAHLLPVPASWLQKAVCLLGKEDVAVRLLGSLQITMRKTCEMLNWSPPVSVDEALRKTAKAYLQAQ